MSQTFSSMVDQGAKAVSEGAKVFTHEALAKGLTQESSARLGRRIGKLLDRELQTLAMSGTQTACREGCDHCCHRMIHATPPEVGRIWEVVKAMPKQDQVDLVARLPVEDDALAVHRGELFTRYRGACPFLVDRRCSIYADRPFMCRSAFSRDAEICRQFKEETSSYIQYSPHGESQVGEAAMNGIQESYRTFLPPVLLELPHALQKLLSGEASEEDLARRPSLLFPRSDRPWEIRSPAPIPDPLDGPPIPLEKVMALEGRFEMDLWEGLKPFASRRTFDAMARIAAPSAFRDSGDMEEWKRHWEVSIDAALSDKYLDPAEAYKAIVTLAPSKIAYLDFDVRPTQEKLGTLLVSRIANRLAPEISGSLGKRQQGRLRVGFIGSIGVNSGTQWAKGWVQNLDRTEFEVSVLNIGPGGDSTSAVSFQFKEAADHYYRLGGHPLETARFIRSLDLDYLVYCDIGDIGLLYQYGIFQLARVQAAAWGCPFTSGLPTIQYYLSSEWIEPADGDDHYSETLIRLPGSGLHVEPPSKSRLNWDRDRFGFPKGFLAGFFQVPQKWLPTRDEVFARIAERTTNPIIVIDGSGPYARQIFSKRMEALGVPLIWMPKSLLAIFQRAVELSDVCLDGLDWSGGLTVLQSLAVGTPFVVLPGTYARQRLALGTLRAVGGEGLIASDVEDYVELATSPDRLRAAMAKVSMDRLYRDVRPIRALEEHIRSSCTKL